MEQTTPSRKRSPQDSQYECSREPLLGNREHSRQRGMEPFFSPRGQGIRDMCYLETRLFRQPPKISLVLFSPGGRMARLNHAGAARPVQKVGPRGRSPLGVVSSQAIQYSFHDVATAHMQSFSFQQNAALCVSTAKLSRGDVARAQRRLPSQPEQPPTPQRCHAGSKRVPSRASVSSPFVTLCLDVTFACLPLSTPFRDIWVVAS
ncbi:hypothetical protein BaRGS_00008522 [Batillaria attramentaria]|uniref:Uncharacterized protein n=1 Tax=Batillaria attramentaria TaxID=370345 RepID=A0ABD0LL78_9CAEN